MFVRLLLSGILSISVTIFLMAQNVGINMPTPTAPLHVVRSVPTSGPKLNHVMAIFESNEESFIQLSNPENMATGILSGDRWTPIRSSLIFNGDSSILFKSGGDLSRMILNNKGQLGINTLSPLAQLHVQDSSVLFSGSISPPPNPSPPPISGQGIRMMWYADKAAFRSGYVDDTNWDKDNVGTYSVALGFDGLAKGNYSTAIGLNGNAYGFGSTVLGNAGQAKGDFSFTYNWTIAKSYASFVVGTYNDTTSLSSAVWNPNDPLFIIGNGTNHNARNNAMTVLKNGKTGINTASPQSMLHIVRNGVSSGPYAVNAIATFESNSSSWIHLKHPSNAQAGILSGNEVTSIRSGILFDIDSSLLFRTGGNFTRMKLNNIGYLGINTTTPQSLLHIRKSGPSGGPIHWNAIATLESNTHGYLQFSQSNTTEAGFLSGNTSTDIRSALIFGVDSSMMFRTGGNLNRMYITKSGRIGVNTTTPAAFLHLKEESAGNAYIQPSATAIIEKNSSSCLQFITPTDGWSGIISTDPENPNRSGVIFNADGSLSLKTGGSTTSRLTVDASGNTGIGTTEPGALLDVNGTFRLGDQGDALNKIKQSYMALNLPSISGGASYTATFAIANVGLGGTAFVSPNADLPDGIVIAYARCTIGLVHVKFSNITSSAINPPSEYFYVTVIQ